MKKRIISVLIVAVMMFSIGCAAKEYMVLKSADRNNAEDWLEMGNLLYRLRDYGTSIDYYEKILDNYPDSVYAEVSKKKLEKAK
ncbi:MAG: hypothetical protein ABH836_00360, partial [Candidatus Omnitrophota bacterium]